MVQRPSAPDDLRRWGEVDRYFEEELGAEDSVLRDVLAAGKASGLPEIQVAPLQGKFLHLLARGIRARRILEIGTLAGYSTVWLARALPPDGRLISLEVDPNHARVARGNLARAKLDHAAEIRVGPALDSLGELAREQVEPFDLVFIDADKTSYPDYLDWAIRLCRPGAIVVADNVVRRGDVRDENHDDPNVQGVRAMIARASRDPRVVATVLQTVGGKGHDGMFLAVVEGPPPRERGPRGE